jgi:hypothetical protein
MLWSEDDDGDDYDEKLVTTKHIYLSFILFCLVNKCTYVVRLSQHMNFV